MVKVGILMVEGFEEGETLTIVDILRRANVDIRMIGLGGTLIKGMQGIRVISDEEFCEKTYDLDGIIIPGGRPGGFILKENQEVLNLISNFNKNNKLIAAICSGTLSLEAAGVIKNKRVTGYTGYEGKLISGIFTGNLVEEDGNIITSKRPATGYAFAFKILEHLGIDTLEIKKNMLYNLAKGY